MKLASLPEWLTWLEHHHPSEIDLGLARIKQVAAVLDLLAPRAQVVTVAGTNGKGSCVTAITALVKQAGLRVGTYTSPHIHCYNERIALDGVPAADSDIVAAFAAIYDACSRFSPAISLTYFEYGTLAALYVFAQKQVDVVVLEVGLGGRLDAVNIIDADVAVVTSIDIDHQDWLGDTRELIGFEKAGIYRGGRPAICADANSPQSLLDHAQAIGANLQCVNRDFSYAADVAAEVWSWSNDANHFACEPLPQLPLPSMAAAVQAVSALGLRLSSETFACLAQLRVPGRFQTLNWRERRLVLDVAHNPAATAFLRDKLTAHLDKAPAARVVGLVGMMSDKDRLQSLHNLQSLMNAWYVVALPDNSRAASVEHLSQDLESLDCVVTASGELQPMLEAAVSDTQPGDVIVIFGSFFTVAAALPYLTDAQSV